MADNKKRSTGQVVAIAAVALGVVVVLAVLVFALVPGDKGKGEGGKESAQSGDRNTRAAICDSVHTLIATGEDEHKDAAAEQRFGISLAMLDSLPALAKNDRSLDDMGDLLAMAKEVSSSASLRDGTVKLSREQKANVEELCG